MGSFLTGDYTAVIFEQHGEAVAYALYRDHPDRDDSLYLRQIFVHRNKRRQGVGRSALRILRDEIWPQDKRIAVEVLVGNHAARQFYDAIGFRPYCVELEMAPAAEIR